MIKIPLTDKFLWTLYDLGEALRLPAMPRGILEATTPDFFRMKQVWRKMTKRRNFSQFIYHLKRGGLIKIDNLEKRKAIILTPKGLGKIQRIKYKVREKKKRVDRKWQMIIFDVPEKKRRSRDLLRENLIFLGYRMLQKSIWICPYDVEKETEEFLRNHSLDPYVRMFLVEEVEI